MQTNPVIIICSGDKGKESFNHGRGKREGLWERSAVEVILKLRQKKQWDSLKGARGAGLCLGRVLISLLITDNCKECTLVTMIFEVTTEILKPLGLALGSLMLMNGVSDPPLLISLRGLCKETNHSGLPETEGVSGMWGLQC